MAVNALMMMALTFHRAPAQDGQSSSSPCLFHRIELPGRTFPACRALRPRSISLLRDRAMYVSFYSTAMLAIESCNVISLRLTKLMDGSRESHEEARLMV
jgi:hypothetical protein